MPARDRRPLIERMIERTPGYGSDGCWPITGYHDRSGYGLIAWTDTDGQHMDTTHRIAWRHFFGAIPDDRRVLHWCDNPPCWNPKCLHLGDQPQNMREMYERGRRVYPRGADHPLVKNPERAVRGEQHSKARLTEADVLEIRASWPGKGAEHWNFCVRTAERYGVRPQSIEKVVLRINWRHL